ncbi:MAG: hypothetical protein WAO02_06640 [Verrucomicrobiia bacterium]
MTDGHLNFNRLEALRRYVPPAVWAIVILVILLIPLKIISQGYLPEDDALRHAAKAVSGRPWGDILVLGPAFRDQNFVWHFFLRQIFLLSHCDTDTLVIVSVAGLFALFGWTPLPWLKRPEAWLITLTIVTLTSGLMSRLMFGRPFLLTLSGLVTILCAWQFRGSSPPRWRTLAWVSAVIAVCSLVHGVWYLWALPVAAFFLAGQFRWGIMLAAGWAGGSFLGAAVTGHPIDALGYAVGIAQRTLGLHDVQNTMTGELQSFGGGVYALLVVGGLLVLRNLGGLNTRPWKSNPAFWLACLGWLLGFKAIRFWNDWGWPALMVLTTCDLQLLLEARFAADSLKRLALTAGLAVMTFMAATSDYGSRWTQNLTWSYLTQDNADLKGWLPDRGGIFYTADMTLFFQTFFKNPDADWKYIVGYEPALMPDEDFAVYRRVLWNFGDAKAYQPWVDKMRPPDRLIVRGAGGAPPNIPQLEWKYGVSGIWLGRLPQTNAPPQEPPALTPAATREISTKAVESAQ